MNGRLLAVDRVPVQSEEQIRNLAAEILSRSPYAQWRHPDNQLGWRWLLDALASFFDALGRLADTRPLLYAALMIVLLAIAVLLLWHVIYSVRRALLANGPSPAVATVAVPDLREEARRLAAAGRFLDAARHLQLAALELLLQRGVLQLGRSEPNRTLRQRLRAAALPPREREELLRLIDELERQWFRDRQGEPRLYDGWQVLVERLVDARVAAP